jgi:hypothetical protein
MDPRDEFFTGEFMRYSAECRRMARFAKPPPGQPAAAGWRTYLNSTSWIALLRPADATENARRLQFATASGRR